MEYKHILVALLLIIGVHEVKAYTKLAGDGYVKALVSKPLEIFWYHDIIETQIVECSFSHFRRFDQSEEEFFIYSHHFDEQTGRIEITDRAKKWSLISKSNECRQCHAGIRNKYVELSDDGFYGTSLYLKNKTHLDSPKLNVKVYAVADLKFTVQVGDIVKDLSINDSFDITLDVILGKGEGPPTFLIQLNETFPLSNIITEIRKGYQTLHKMDCMNTTFCETNLTEHLGSGYGIIWTSIDAGIQNAPNITIKQPFNYTGILDHPDRRKGVSTASVVGITLAVLVLLVLLAYGVHKKQPWFRRNKKDDRTAAEYSQKM